MLGAVPPDAVLKAVSYLGALEVAACVEAKVVEAREVPGVCARIGGEAYEALVKAASKSRGKGGTAWSAIEVLRASELQRVAEGLNRATDEGSRGYYVSKNWASQARRYCEASRARVVNRETASKGRGRSSSESLPPWPDANADLVCEHGALAPRSVPRAKRIVVDRAAWRAVVHRFPLSTKFKASTAAECAACLAAIGGREKLKREAKRALEDEKKRRLSELEPRREISLLLRGLHGRDRAKRGVPPRKVSGEATLANERGARVPPLVPGRYHLVPRAWLQSWRSSIRNPSAPRPGPPPNCLCVAHGRPLVSPDLQSFLAGDAQHLALPKTSTTAEIVDADEWRAINALFPVDFAVAFDVAADIQGLTLDLAWVTEPCRLCDSSGTADDLPVKFRNRDASKRRTAGANRTHYYDDDHLVF